MMNFVVGQPVLSGPVFHHTKLTIGLLTALHLNASEHHIALVTSLIGLAYLKEPGMAEPGVAKVHKIG